MSPAFLDWLETFKDKFKTYTLDEIGYLAQTCGFDIKDVQQWKTREKFRRGGSHDRVPDGNK